MKQRQKGWIIFLIAILVTAALPAFGTTKGTTAHAAALPYATQAEAAVNHLLILLSDGTVQAMGDNDLGQLGNGKEDDELDRPVQVLTALETPLTNIKAIAAGEDYSLAVDTSGQVWFWGYNHVTEDSELYAVLVSGFGGKTVTAIAAGVTHNLALTNDGQVWAWGENDFGQLAAGYRNSTANDVPSPVKTDDGSGNEIALSHIKEIAAGAGYSMALDQNGRIWGWGLNMSGVIGFGDIDFERIAEEITEDSEGAINVDPNIFVPGSPSNYFAILQYILNSEQYVDEMIVTLAKPVTRGSDRFKHIAAGGMNSLAIHRDGSVRFWGMVFDIEHGHLKLHDGERLSFGSGGQSAADIFAGVSSINGSFIASSYIRLTDGTNWCIGSFCPSGKTAYTPEKVTELTGFRSISLSDSYALGVKEDATVWMWAMLPNLSNAQYTPVLSTISDAERALAGNEQSIVIKKDGTVWEWGKHNSKTPKQVMQEDEATPFTNVVQLSRNANGQHTLALKNDGMVYSWGKGSFGQLGHGNTQDADLPKQVVNDNNGRLFANMKAVAAGDSHSLALGIDGGVWGWGSGLNGELAETHSSVHPEQIIPADLNNPFVAIEAGKGFSSAIKQDGTVWSWGSNYHGQLGNLESSQNKVPQQVVTLDSDNTPVPLEGIVAIAAGESFTLALQEIGGQTTVWAWGDNRDGQLGAGKEDQSVKYAVQVIKEDETPLQDIKAIAAGAYHAMAVDGNGKVWVWGDNYTGQLGVGERVFNSAKAIELQGVSNAAAVSAGYNHSFVLDQSGKLWAFGEDEDGQLGIISPPKTLKLHPLTFFPARPTDPKPEQPGGNWMPSFVDWNALISTTDGKLSLPAGRAGETRLGDRIKLSVPAGATTESMIITVVEVLDTAGLIQQGEVLLSSVFDLRKDVSGNFKKPVTITMKFDAAKLQSGQHPSIFYYDETAKVWVEIGGQVSGDMITVEVDYLRKFAVFAVNDKADETNETLPAVEVDVHADVVGHWAEAAVKQAVAAGFVNGYPDGTFKPNGTITRAEFAVMLMKALKSGTDSAELDFADTVPAWAQHSVAQAVEAEIIRGYEDGTFRGGASISRAELAVIIARASGVDLAASASTGFADEQHIPAWAMSAVAAVKQLGIVNGRSGGRYAPNETATRAEAVTMIVKLLALEGK
ncbi:hypothetical protein EBB07_26020 [Paenibacillaceae bacterium]|nr:hypothetical protein EBB07_26020 [Paenibacillaceae bacterium]